MESQRRLKYNGMVNDSFGVSSGIDTSGGAVSWARTGAAAATTSRRAKLTRATTFYSETVDEMAYNKPPHGSDFPV